MVIPMLKKAFPPRFWPWKTSWFFTFKSALLFINTQKFNFAVFCLFILFDIAVGKEFDA